MSLIRARFTRGSSYININDLTSYGLGENFRPPPVLYSVNTAPGLALNYYDGAVLVGKKAQNRSFNFTLHVVGSTEADIKAKIRRLNDFVNSGSEHEPVYLEMRGHNIYDYLPKWGQDTMRYQVVEGAVYAGENYALGSSRESTLPNCQVTLTVRPFALGQEQRLASAKGAVLEDTIGMANGGSRGVIINGSATNKMTNPIFGHTTWNNGWNTGAGAISAENTSLEFILFGKSSGKITGIAGSNNLFYQNINAGSTATHTLTCFVKRPDGGAVTTSDINLYYNGSDLTTTFINRGNGWYRAVASFTAVSSSVATGIRIKNGRTVYVDQFDFIGTVSIRPPINGDMLGCAWSSTVHASTSVATVAYLRLPSSLVDIASGTVRVVWRPDHDYSFGTSRQIFMTGASLRVVYSESVDKFFLTDDTNSASTSVQSFAANVPIVLHFTWGPGGLAIYINGSVDGTSATYTPKALGTHLYIGCDTSVASHAFGTFMDFVIFDRAMTAAEAAADYANIYPQVAAGERVGWIPYLWTKDGDDVIDNCDDSTRDNWAVVGSVPGSVPADTYWHMDCADALLNNLDIWLGLHVDNWRDWRIYGDRFYFEGEGDLSSSADAGASGGAYGSTDTLPLLATNNAAFTEELYAPDTLYGPFHFFVRAGHSAGTQNVNIFPFLVTSDENVLGDPKTISVTTSYKLYYAGRVDLGPWVGRPKGEAPWPLRLGVAFYGGTSGAIKYDFGMCINGGLAQLRLYATGLTYGPDTGITPSSNAIYLQGRQVQLSGRAVHIGDVIDLWPGRANTVSVIIGDDRDALDITDTLTFSKIVVMPRWAIL